VAKKAKKLEIRAPGQEVPALVFAETVGVTFLVCGVLMWILTVQVFWKDRVVVPDTRTAEEKLVEELEAAPAEREWTPGELEVALSAGTLEVAERACEELVRVARGEQELGDEERARAEGALAVALEKEGGRAPLACAMRARFEGVFEENAQLAATLDRVWGRLKAHELEPAPVSAMVERMMVERRRPEAPEFYAWLRRCAMRAESEQFFACASMARQLAPKQGEDYLMMIDKHVSQEGWGEGDDVGTAALALARVALAGQPRQWSVESSPTIKRYDYEAKIGAVFMLCRLMQSPKRGVREQAAKMLGHTAKMGARKLTDDKLERWQEGCKLAFGKPLPDLKIVELPLVSSEEVEELDVWSGVEGEAPRHGLEYAVSTGACAEREGEPLWRCGVSKWKGRDSDVSDALKDVYIHTRYIEWDEWDLVKKQDAGEAPAPVAEQ
jgi:hypothetical protein